MHKSDQQVTITYTIDGPDGEGLFYVWEGSESIGLYCRENDSASVSEAIRLHLASTPVEPVEIDGYLVAPRPRYYDVAAWGPGCDPEGIARGDYPCVSATSVDNAADLAILHNAKYTPAYKALIKYFIRKEAGTL